MNFAPLTQFNKFLSLIKPQTTNRGKINEKRGGNWSSALPAMAWEDVVLTPVYESQLNPSENCDGAISEAKRVIVHTLSSENELEALIQAIYPKLNLVEWVHLVHDAKFYDLPIREVRIAELYGFRLSEDFNKTCELILTLPEEFQVWCAEKNIASQDLSPLRALKSIEPVGFILDKISKLNPTRSDGIQILEWSIDLYLMDVNLVPAFEAVENIKILQDRLKVLRYPMATQQALVTEDKIRKLPWPKKSEVRAARRGDQSGVEVKIFMQNSTQLKKYIEGLTQVALEIDKTNLSLNGQTAESSLVQKHE